MRTRLASALLCALCLLAIPPAIALAGPDPATPRAAGSCCMADGSCEVTDEVGCYQAGGLAWTEGGACPGACAPAGGCCLPDGSCIVVEQQACTADGGQFGGGLAPCPPAVCKVPVGTCTIAGNPIPTPGITRNACCYQFIRGVWVDLCSWNVVGNRWIPPSRQWRYTGVVEVIGRGGCCLPDGTCQVVTQPTCDSEDGVFQGVGTQCSSPLYCGPTPTGLCCRATGGCALESEAACDTRGGVVWTAFEGCDDGCLPTGGCCLDDGTCVTVNQADCSLIGGRYDGDGVACDAVACQPVAAQSRTWGSLKMLFR